MWSRAYTAPELGLEPTPPHHDPSIMSSRSDIGACWQWLCKSVTVGPQVSDRLAPRLASMARVREALLLTPGPRQVLTPVLLSILVRWSQPQPQDLWPVTYACLLSGRGTYTPRMPCKKALNPGRLCRGGHTAVRVRAPWPCKSRLPTLPVCHVGLCPSPRS